MTTLVTWLLPAVLAVVMVVSGRFATTVPVTASILIGAAARIVEVLAASQRYTPNDVRTYFLGTGTAVLHGQDPILTLPGPTVEFLELMPWIHALEFKTGLPWVYAVKLVPVAADLVLVWLVSRLATDQSQLRAFQYAVNPVSLVVVSIHGQVEPIALALAIGGILLLRDKRLFLAGVLLGAAVAAKTWPAFVLVAVLPITKVRQTATVIAGAIVVPILSLLSGVVLLHANPLSVLIKAADYSGYVSGWTWSGLFVQLGLASGGYDRPIAKVGTAISIVAVALILYRLRESAAEIRALCVVAAALVTGAGFGVQYLMWVMPLAMALSGPRRLGYALTAGAWATLFYLYEDDQITYLRGLSWLPALFLVGLITEQLRTSAPRRWRQAESARPAVSDSQT